MRTFDQSLLKLYQSKKIDLKTALANADSSSELEWKINFGGGGGTHAEKGKEEALEFPTTSDDLKK